MIAGDIIYSVEYLKSMNKRVLSKGTSQRAAMVECSMESWKEWVWEMRR